MKKIFLLPVILLSLLMQAQTKTVVVLPSKDTTVVTFTATPTASNSINFSTVVHPTKTPPVNPPTDTTVVPPVPDLRYTLIYSNGFDVPNDLDPFNHAQYGKGFIDLNNYLTGPGSFHSRPATVSQGERSEVSLDPETPLEGAVEYDEYYYYAVQNQCHDIQWHPTTGGGSASPGGWHVNGKLVFRNWTSKTGNVDHPASLTLQTGIWYHFRIEYKFGSTGYFRHYTDGQQDCTWTGQVGDGSTPYFKLGFNGAFLGDKAEADKSDILYDNLKIYKLNGSVSNSNIIIGTATSADLSVFNAGPSNNKKLVTSSSDANHLTMSASEWLKVQGDFTTWNCIMFREL